MSYVTGSTLIFEWSTDLRLSPLGQTTPVNGSFSLIKELTVQSAGKTLHTANDVHKIVLTKTLLEYSNDYA